VILELEDVWPDEMLGAEEAPQAPRIRAVTKAEAVRTRRKLYAFIIPTIITRYGHSFNHFLSIGLSWAGLSPIPDFPAMLYILNHYRAFPGELSGKCAVSSMRPNLMKIAD